MLYSSSLMLFLAILSGALYSQTTCAELGSSDQAKKDLESCLDNLKIPPEGKCNFDERQHLEVQYGLTDMIRSEKVTLKQRMEVSVLKCLPPSRCIESKCDCGTLGPTCTTKVQNKGATCDKEFDEFQLKVKAERMGDPDVTSESALTTTVTPPTTINPGVTPVQPGGNGNGSTTTDRLNKLDEAFMKRFDCLQSLNIRYNEPCSQAKINASENAYFLDPDNLSLIIATELERCFLPSTCVDNKCFCHPNFTFFCDLEKSKTRNTGVKCEAEHEVYLKIKRSLEFTLPTEFPSTPTTTPGNGSGITELAINVNNSASTYVYHVRRHLGIFLVLLAL